MGQYYKPVIKQDKKTMVFDRSVEPDKDYVMAKLMEHSWWFNTACNAVAKMLYKKKGQLYWCGDYAEDPVSKKAWKEDKKDLSLPNPDGFNLNGKYLVNWTDKTYVDCDKYYRSNMDEDGWVIFPLSLLTAQGNGLGGGDYEGSDMDLVGDWAGEEISVEDDIPSGFKELEVLFMEKRYG